MENQNQTPPPPPQQPVTQNTPQTDPSTGLPASWLPTQNKPALIGYYMGFVGLLPFVGFPFAVAALVLGIIGLKHDKLTKVPGAKAHAITAVVLGSLSVTCGVLFGLLMVLAAMSRP